MYQLEILAIEHIRDLRREADQARAVAELPQATVEPVRIAVGRIAGNTLLWASKRLSNWGEQLQNGSPALR